ncbi:Cyclic nucleotide-binding domain family protein [Acanthocheilonema viteae]
MGVIGENEDGSINSIEKLSLVTEENISNIQSEREAVEKADGQMSMSIQRCSSASVGWPDDMLTSEMSRTGIDSDCDDQSRLSFIMKEKLHALTGNMRRRTSQMVNEIMRESDDEEKCLENIELDRKEHRLSLMSLIGLQRRASPVIDSDINKSKNYLRRIFLSSINPFLVIAFLYNAFGIPLRSSYPYQTESNLIYWLIADYIADAIYLIDMLLIKPRLRFMRGGLPVKDIKETAKRYVRSINFKLDLISLIPFDIIYIWTGPIAAWRAVRMCKLLSFWQLFSLLDNSVSNPYIIRITKTLAYMIYLIHCNSCIYYTLSAWQAFGQIAYRMNNKWYLNKWVYNNQGNAYIRCFYFTTAVATSTGNNPAPTNIVEYVYMTFSWMMGVFVFALLLGQISCFMNLKIRDIVSNANRNRENYRKTVDQVLSECKRLGLSKDTINRVRDWFIYTWQKQKALDEKILIEKLPLKLQTDLALSVHYNTLSKVQLFQDCDRALLRGLVLKLRPVIFLPGDMICKKGDIGKEMYIVNDGILQVVDGEQSNKVFAELTEGSVFGEISLLAIDGNNRRTANIRSRGYSTLFVLSKEDLNDVIKDYPDAQELLKRKAREMLKKDEKAEKKISLEKTMENYPISAHINTPRLINTVIEAISSNSPILKQIDPSGISNRLKMQHTDVVDKR